MEKLKKKKSLLSKARLDLDSCHLLTLLAHASMVTLLCDLLLLQMGQNDCDAILLSENMQNMPFF